MRQSLLPMALPPLVVVICSTCNTNRLLPRAELRSVLCQYCLYVGQNTQLSSFTLCLLISHRNFSSNNPQGDDGRDKKKIITCSFKIPPIKHPAAFILTVKLRDEASAISSGNHIFSLPWKCSQHLNKANSPDLIANRMLQSVVF